MWDIHEAVKSEMHLDDAVSTLNAAEEQIKKFRQQRYHIIDSFVACQREAQNLIHHLRLELRSIRFALCLFLSV